LRNRARTSRQVFSKKGASKKNGMPRAKETAKGARSAKAAKTEGGSLKKVAKACKKGAKPERKTSKAEPKATAPRAESKGAKILEMIGRAKGATLAELMKAAGWQAHSVRGFISTAGKKDSVKIESSKNEAGDRVYKMAK
jgi:hypothetical protein